MLRFSDATLAHGGQLRLTGQSQEQQGLPTAAPKVMTGDLTLDLPEGTSTVRIDPLEGATWARATVREGRHPALTEAEYWDFLRRRTWRAWPAAGVLRFRNKPTVRHRCQPCCGGTVSSCGTG
ncbi:hypothetical protein [Marinobacter similis]|uniref:hypothetical protein n=1 Tax=Marinobacter similis TaxID=1420916 RepID=UPI0011DDBA1D|nr:hypothetical protein [Marinobacter similis]